VQAGGSLPLMAWLTIRQKQGALLWSLKALGLLATWPITLPVLLILHYRRRARTTPTRQAR
jgi:hypothetical protein